MNENKLPCLLYLVIVLLVINIAATGYLVFSGFSGNRDTRTQTVNTKSKVTKDKAMALAKVVIDKYNANDAVGLYSQFDALAKMQFTQEQLTESVQKLNTLMGKVDDFTYSHAEPSGKQAGKEFLTLFYKARLSGGTFTSGEVKLNVAIDVDDLALFGFFIFGHTK